MAARPREAIRKALFLMEVYTQFEHPDTPDESRKPSPPDFDYASQMLANVNRMSPAEQAQMMLHYADANPATCSDGVKLRELCRFSLSERRRRGEL